MLPIDGYCVPGPVRRLIFAVASPAEASAFVANKRANVAIEDVIINLILSPDIYIIDPYIADDCYFYFKVCMSISIVINN